MKRRAMVSLGLALGVFWGFLSPSADFDGDGVDDIGVFRPSSGLWAVRGMTRAYWGRSGDVPVPGDYSGDGRSDIACYRPSTSYWFIKDLTKVFWGKSGDTPLPGTGGPRTYDYVVKPGDANDLVRALESTSYNSVFIPDGTYFVNQVITVTDLKHIIGESNSTIIQFLGASSYLKVESAQCHLENLRFSSGGVIEEFSGAVRIDAQYVRVDNCRSVSSLANGFYFTSAAANVSFINCIVRTPALHGFAGPNAVENSRFSNCITYGGQNGFHGCYNLAACQADSAESIGFNSCVGISASSATNCVDYGFYNCQCLSSCRVVGNGTTDTGFDHCLFVSSSYAIGCDFPWGATLGYVDEDSCNYTPGP